MRTHPHVISLGRDVAWSEEVYVIAEFQQRIYDRITRRCIGDCRYPQKMSSLFHTVLFLCMKLPLRSGELSCLIEAAKRQDVAASRQLPPHICTLKLCPLTGTAVYEPFLADTRHVKRGARTQSPGRGLTFQPAPVQEVKSRRRQHTMLARIMHHVAVFCTVSAAGTLDCSVLLDRCEATRRATHLG